MVLLATSDDVAWLIARHRDALSEVFRLDMAPLPAIEALLSKRRLAAAGAKVGLRSPESFFPSSDGELTAMAEKAPLPLLIKPTTQILLGTGAKGRTVTRRSDLLPSYRAFQRANVYPGILRASVPECDWPLLQAFRPEAASGIYSLAGYCPRDSGDLVVLGAKKILQRPRQLGIGLCFEAAPVRAALRKAIAALCREVGYWGVFEAEIIDTSEGPLLIDFNPRFYSQMAFEIDRGLPLPLISYLAACGDAEGLDLELQRAHAATRGESQRVYVHRLVLSVLTRAQKLSGAMSASEAEGWMSWLAVHAGEVSDAVIDRSDPVPTAIDWAGTLLRYARRPRSFVRNFALGK
jgi:predicted ATP-grasp superfamily ATP-dependent carboligase